MKLCRTTTICRTVVAGVPAATGGLVACALTLLALAATLLMIQPRGCPAAEISLRPQCACGKPLVTLGDVAEVFASDQQQAAALAAIELFPAPTTGHQRFLRLREIQDLLALRGVSLVEHRFSGSSQVTILAGAEPPRVEVEQPLSFVAARRAVARVREAILQYLRENAGADLPWIVELELPPAHAKAVADPSQAISVVGGSAPWTGTQRYEVTVGESSPPVQFSVDARVAVPAAVVVTLHSLGRGVLIRDTDVELQHGVQREAGADAFYALEEVVGKETARAVPAGKTVSHDSVRAPLLVRRGEVVTVYARSADIRVRTTARARDDGSLGDLVAVESLQDRGSYLVRVSGVRETEVFARATQVEPAAGPTKVGRPRGGTKAAVAVRAGQKTTSK